MKAMIIFILVNILMSCNSTLFPDENLTLQKTPYTGNQLCIDGYYIE
jgi:hypothetical protein